MRLDAGRKQFFEDNGYLLLEQVYSPDEVAEHLIWLVHGLERGELSFEAGAGAHRFVPSPGR